MAPTTTLAASAGILPATGSSSAPALIVFGLALAGGGFVVLATRRRPSRR